MFTLAELDNVIPLVRAIVPPTPQYAWPLLKALTGVEIIVKHENHTPIGAFKLRGGIVYFDRLNRARPQVQGIVTATRGNHGQSLAFAGSHTGIAVTIVVPHGNSTEKNAAMRAFGAELIELKVPEKGHKIEVKGFASAKGSKSANQKLSEQRARAVTQILLQDYHVPLTDMITPAGMGESQQVGEEVNTPQGEAQNRRVRVRILQNKGVTGL